MRHRYIHQLIAALVLTAYAVVGTSALPAVLAFVAAWDSSHQLIVRESKDGLEIALHHQSGCMTPDVSDHDSEIAKWLVSLSKPTQQGDHLVVCSEAIAATTAHESLLQARALKSASLENLYASLVEAFCIAWPLGSCFRQRQRACSTFKGSTSCHRRLASGC